VKKSKFSEHPVVTILKQCEPGQKVNDACREHGVSAITYDQWNSKYGGDLKCIKALEAENTQLKRMYAEKSMRYEAIQDVLEGCTAIV
jgi:putative transposase